MNKVAEIEHYPLALSSGGGTTSQCACGKVFSFEADLQGHIDWQLKKLAATYEPLGEKKG